MTDRRVDGRRRLDRVLTPSFTEGLADLTNDELHQRREDARLEEREVSYIRRLLQGRLDLLRAELERRRTGAPPGGPRADADLVDDLSSAMAEHPPGVMSRHLVDVEPPDQAQRRRAAEVAVADVRLSDPSAMDDEELEQVVAHLDALERRASATRRAVITVLDTLGSEVQRRVVEGRFPPDVSAT